MRKILFTYCLFLVNSCFCQVTAIPDSNFRNYLKIAFPTYMTSDGKLIDSMALKYNSTMVCSSKDINSLVGIQKFKNLRILICNDNNLTSLDSISNLTNLQELYFHNNFVTQLPEFDKLSNLVTIRASNNKLISLPDLSKNIKLKTLQCDENQITTIIGLSKLINLENLIIYNNEISGLGDLSPLQNLMLLECHGNQLDTLLGLKSLKKLVTLVAGANLFRNADDITGLSNLVSLGYWVNQINVLPDVSQMTKLELFDFNNNKIKYIGKLTNSTIKYFHCQDNLLDSIENIDSLKVLEEFFIKNNRLKNLPSLANSKTKLKAIDVSQNLLDKLPDLSIYISLQSLKVQNNNLTFEDIEPLLLLPNLKTLEISPQNYIPSPSAMNVDENTPFRWILNIDKTLKNNSYEWYRNGVLLTTTQTDTLIIEKISMKDAGTYKCLVKNNKISSLTLETADMSLKVIPCIDLGNFKYQTSDIGCSQSGKIIIDYQSINSVNKNYTYSLENIKTGEVTTSKELVFDNLHHNEYTLFISNAAACKNQTEIKLEGSIANCDKGVIIASGKDANRTSFFIEGTGEIKVYDKAGYIVRKMNAPISWDGKLDSGEIIPGLYILQVGSRYLEVTVIQ